MIVDRKASRIIDLWSRPGKVVVILGARRTGKTVLLKEYLKNQKTRFLFWNGEDIAVHELLKRRSIKHYKNIIGDNKLIAIDEAQVIPDIGKILKLLIDSFDDLRIIVTGSSAFDLTNIKGEPLTGRKHQITLYPLSEAEYASFEKPQEKKDNLMERLVFGNMPELLRYKTSDEKSSYLRELISSYLLKDILVYENIRSSSKIFELLKLIAFQTGSEVSVQELSKQLAVSRKTVEEYLDLLSKVFIIYRLTGFSRNLRKEIVKNSKWYFYDNGIRNAVIANFAGLNMRNDTESLWENYMMSERMKQLEYSGIAANKYFWRTYDQQEIDLIEEREGKLFAYEFKWKKDKGKIPAAWEKAYSGSQFKVVTPDNYSEWLLEKQK